MESQYPQCIVDGQPYLPGCISILSYLEKRLMVVLRDGKTFIGYLQSIDQFANLLLSKTKERIYVGSKFGDIERGLCQISIWYKVSSMSSFFPWNKVKNKALVIVERVNLMVKILSSFLQFMRMQNITLVKGKGSIVLK